MKTSRHDDFDQLLDRMLAARPRQASSSFTERTLAAIEEDAHTDHALEAMIDNCLARLPVTADDGFSEKVMRQVRPARRTTLAFFPAWAKPLAWAAVLVLSAFFGLQSRVSDRPVGPQTAQVLAEEPNLDTELAQILILAGGLDEKSRALLDDDYLDAVAVLAY